MEMYRDWTVPLPKTAAAWKAGQIGDIESTLDDDLAGNVLEFLDDACESGGWPENDELTVEEIAVDGRVLTADISVTFTEVIASGCKDMPHYEEREARLVITLEYGKNGGSVEYSPADPSTWDIIDRNSASDGT